MTTLAGGAAARFLRQAEGADNETVQGFLARATATSSAATSGDPSGACKPEQTGPTFGV